MLRHCRCIHLVPFRWQEPGSEFNPSFIIHILASVDYKVLYNTVTNEVPCSRHQKPFAFLTRHFAPPQLKLKGFPEKIPEGKLDAKEHATFLKAVHDALVDVS